MTTDSVLARIEARSSPEPNSGCILWMGYVNKGGYGCIKWRGHSHLAHRVAWEITNGPIPDGLHVCHKCDVPSCINTAHIFLGTDADNTADRVRKGRSARNFNLNGARLTPAQVLAIRCDGRSCETLGRIYGVSHSTIHFARRGDTWRHINPDLTTTEGK